MAERGFFSNLVSSIFGANTPKEPLPYPAARNNPTVIQPPPLTSSPIQSSPIQSSTAIKPVIAISGGSADSKSVAAAVAMVRAQGAEPLVITEHQGRNVAQDMSRVDGLVLLGNDYDIDPASYGQQAHPQTLNENDPDLLAKMAAKKGRALTESEKKTIENLPHRAAYENQTIRIAIDQKIPLTTICAADQRLNVALGGTLHQHIPDLIGNNNHMQSEAPYVPVQPISIDPNSLLGRLGKGIRNLYAPQPGAETAAPLTLMENSFHHQAVDKIAPGLVASAHYADSYTGPDGHKQMLVGGIEPDPNGPYANQFILGVQWHPEFGASELGPRIFAGLTDAAKARATERNQAPQTQEARPQWLTQLLHERNPQNQLGTTQDAILAHERKTPANMGIGGR